jgi:dienelactone hydrolase
MSVLFQATRFAFLCVGLSLIVTLICASGELNAQDASWKVIGNCFTPPAEYRGEFGDYRSPLIFNDSTPVETKEDWKRRRTEILEQWHDSMGAWPPLITDPEVEVLEVTQRETFQQLRVRFSWTPKQRSIAYLLIPEGKRPLPAVLVLYYEPKTGIGLGVAESDYALQLTRRGFVTLSMGITEAEDPYKPEDFFAYYPSVENAEVQPMSILAYEAANAWYVLANRPEVDSRRIGVVGHSFGGKWALFASCLFDKFACAAWSDPGIVFDSTKPLVNYWHPWYLGYFPPPWPERSTMTAEFPAKGAYPKLVASGRDLHELHALMAPRPFFVAGGEADPPSRWKALNHSIAVNRLLGFENRVGMANRPKHSPDQESNGKIYAFFEHFLKERDDGAQRNK